MSLRRVAATAALAAIGAGCAGPRWNVLPGPPGPLLAVPANAPVVGLGVEPSPRGLFPKRCLARADRLVQGGTFSMSVQRVEGPFRSGGDEDLDAFVADGARRAEQARPSPGGPPPLAALLTVRTRGQWTSLRQETATLSEEARGLLSDGEGWSFFERCGTHYVQSVRREPSAFAYLALYPSNAAQRDEWAALMAGWERSAPGDLEGLHVLDKLAAGAPWFLAVRADADAAFEVVDPGRAGEGAGTLLGHALQATFGSDRGRIAEVSLRPWSSLPAALRLLQDAREPLRGEPERRERLHQRLTLLQWRALDRQTLLAQAAEAGAGECRAALARALEPFSWDGYERCRSAARESLPLSLEAVEACRPVLAALDADAVPEPCARLSLDESRFGDRRKRMDTRYPLVLELGPGADRLSTDAAQLARPSPPVPLKSACLEGAGRETPVPVPLMPAPWKQDDWDARAFREPPPPKPSPPSPPAPSPPEKDARQGPICIAAPGGGKPVCLHPKGEEAPGTPGPLAKPQPPSPPGNGAGSPREVVLDVSANRRPDGERRWSWWQKLWGPLFLGWKGPEPPRPIYRGAYEVRTLREEEGARAPRLTEEAIALARKDLEAFYRTCGTHRVTQVVARKGIAYHASPGSLYDREVTVIPYGVSAPASGGGAFRPATVQDFLGGRAQWLGALLEPSDGVPDELVVEPWSELLLESGVLRPSQLLPPF